LAIQLHSRTYHSRDQDWDGTVMGDAELGAAGATVIVVTPNQLRHDPEAFVRQVERAYQLAVGRVKLPCGRVASTPRRGALFDVGRWCCWRVPSAHADLCDLTKVGHLASFGLLCGEGPGRQARSGVTLLGVSAIAQSASGPGPSCLQHGTTDRCCEQA